MPNRNPSKSAVYRSKRLAKELGDNVPDDISSDTSSSSDRGEIPRKRQCKTVLEGTSSDESTDQQTNHSQSNEGSPNHDTILLNEVDLEASFEHETVDDNEGEEGGVESDEEDIFEDALGDHVELPEEEILNGEEEVLLGASSESSASDSDSDTEESEEESEEEMSAEEEEPDGEANEGDVPLYANARITLMESLIMILTLSLRFTLSGECIAHILELIEMHCPAGNLCKTSLFTFKNFFVEIGRRALVLHYFCEYCMSRLHGRDSVCNRCGDNTITAFFIEIPLVNQLQRLFLRPGFLNNLMYRFNRVKKHPNNYEDIYDGAVYKEQMNNGFLSHVYNISLMWYTDGIQIFKSTKYAVWPLYFSINELSYKLRTSKENVLLCGLWFGKSKPRPNLFLHPFRETFETFRNTGFVFEVPELGHITVRGKLLCGTCDLQAKSLFLRSKLYSGYYGCAKCYSKGERAPAGRTTVHVHPFTPANNVRLRRNEEVLRCARLATQTRRPHVLGIKGLSMLYFLMHDMIRGTGIDIMHSLFLGVGKLVTKLWFDSKFSAELFSCSAMTDVVNERLKSIIPPSFVQRMTRTLSDLKLWKAKEYKLWFFYYAIPVLSGLLPNEYLVHHMKLVSAVSFLCQESIFPEQVDRAAAMLDEYVRDFQRLYGVRFMGMNVHLLTHLADAVRDLGPLFTTSCFFFEDLNGQLVKLIHGPYQPGIQICSSASLLLSLNLQLDRLAENSVAKQFCVKLRQIGAKFTVAEVIDEKSTVIGKRAYSVNVPEHIIGLVQQQQQQLAGGHFVLFFSLRKKGVFYNSSDKAATRGRCCKYVCCEDDGNRIVGEIAHFVRVSQCGCENQCACLPAMFFCIIRVYERVEWLAHEADVSVFHLFAVTPTDRYVVLSCDKIVSPCFYIEINNVQYLATPINSLEYE